MHGPIAGALALVMHGLGIALAAIGLHTAGDAVGGVGHALLQLRGRALGGVGSHLFFCAWTGTLGKGRGIEGGSKVLVWKSLRNASAMLEVFG